MPPLETPPAPANAVQQCPKLAPVQEPMDMGMLLQYTIGTVNLYNDCRLRHNALINFVTDGSL